MSLTTLTYIAADLIALAVLVGALYAPRHSRKDLMAAYIGVNVGVLAVTLLLSTASVAAGLGLGLFGVLSIIRLRSTELAQHEVAYVVAALWIGDHPALMRRNRHQVIVLDHAITNETALIAHLERTLGGQVRSVEVQRLDLVNDTTIVDVRFRVPRETPAELEAQATRAFQDSQFSDDVVPASSPATEPVSTPAVPASRSWAGTRLSAVQTGAHADQADAQPATITPTAQYVARSAGQQSVAAR